MTETVVATKIHLIESREDPTTLCTKERYSLPKLKDGEKVHLCSVCRKVAFDREEAKFDFVKSDVRTSWKPIDVPPYLRDPH